MNNNYYKSNWMFITDMRFKNNVATRAGMINHMAFVVEMRQS